ncbi:predicted protein [Aspergillus terreus NIH2624]|uniref:Eisosome protein 1 n=1 Tax=Aspergillus terreus (strain NIH 2624 / FGSC A1156) TaxID=341663 RepID=Q0CFT7_ASPTN|nr:uncharacterized protein ATEG_07447 [Aspergillus terreus NIH2624]EAU31709.1 predicted protein [Aspergillus terreus NIH2624]
MATVEQPPVQRIPRSRSARLADQALKETGSRPGYSHASAVAALSQARNRQQQQDRQAAAAFYVQDYRIESPSGLGRQASLSASLNRKSGVSFADDQKYDISAADLSPDVRREIDVREKAISAAKEALYGRRRAGSEPPDAFVHEGSVGGVEGAMSASRIQNAANANARLYTASPPVSPELEEQKRKSVIQAAAGAMARDMYNITQHTDGAELGAAIPAAKRGHVRAVSQSSATKSHATALQHAIAVQEIAQKRAAEKLASMEDENLIYREYYGVEHQPTRSSLTTRKRRGSIESDTSAFDMERSREIRHQMTSLRTKLDAVDEQREKDRALLLEAAKRNVDATMQDMELRVCAQTGRAPPSVRKEWEEAALARAEQDVRNLDAELSYEDKVNLGLSKYMDMSEIEALARSRLQPTFDEITNRAETERAKALEERLDEEERQRQLEIDRQREADTRAEEKREKAALKHDLKTKEGKTWLWRRKSKRVKGRDSTAGTFTTEKVAAEQPQPIAEQRAYQTPQQTTEAQSADRDQGAVASGAGAAESAAMEPVTRSESKLKTWFGRLSGRRSSAAAGEAAGETEQAPEEAVAGEAAAGEAAAGEAAVPSEAPEREVAPAKEEPAAVDTSKTAEDQDQRPSSATGGGATEARENERAAALMSNPVTADDLRVMQRKSVDEGMVAGLGAKKGIPTEGSSDGSENGEWSRLKSRFSKMVSKSSGELKTNGATGYEKESSRGGLPVEHIAADDLPAQARQELREGAADQGLPVPPAIGKQESIGTGRESRFSEDL